MSDEKLITTKVPFEERFFDAVVYEASQTTFGDAGTTPVIQTPEIDSKGLGPKRFDF